MELMMTTFKEGATTSKVTMPNPNQTSTNSQYNLIHSSTKGSNVVVHVDPLDPTSFMSSISQTTLSAIVIISDPPPFIRLIGQIFQLLEWEHGAIFIEIECKIFKISKGKRMIICAPSTQGWHGLIRKVATFSQNGS
jgi:hypothetical protein